MTSATFRSHTRTLLIALSGVVLTLLALTAWESMKLPGHNHVGRSLTLDCNECGSVLRGFVRTEAAAVVSASLDAGGGAFAGTRPK